MKSFVRDFNERKAQLAANDPRHPLFTQGEQVSRSRLQLTEGDPQAALTNASAALDRIEQITGPATNSAFVRMRDNQLRSVLASASLAAIRLDHYAQAETLARKWLPVPADPTSDIDPQENASRAHVVLAHAVAMQGRGDEARTILQPALDYYQHEQQAGAHGTLLRRDFAYALYVSALARGPEVDGNAKRESDLAEAAKLIDGASAEAKKLADMRELADWIAAARASRG
jgi:tetratricopeptide (TPR) repeat protein